MNGRYLHFQDSWTLYIIPQQADSLHSIFSEETEMLMAIAWLCFAASQVTSAAPMSFISADWPLVDYRNFNSSGDWILDKTLVFSRQHVPFFAGQCGVSDGVGDFLAIGNRSKRYVLQGVFNEF